MKYTIESDFQNLFDPLTDEEAKFAKSANEADPDHERIPPIVLWKIDDKHKIVVDGHHTLKIRENMRVNGKPPKIRFVEMEFADRHEAKAYAFRSQFARRNLTDSQRAMKAAEYAKVVQICTSADPGKQGVSKNSSLEMASQAANVSKRSVRYADKVQDHGAKSIQEAVADETVSVSDAAAIVDLPKSEQTAALAKVKAGKARTLRAAAPKAKPKPKPKAGKVKFDYKNFESVFGKLVRLIDDHHRVHPDPTMRDACHESLNTMLADFKAWRRKVKA